MRVQTTQFGEVILRFHHVRHDDKNFVSPVSKNRKNAEETYTQCEIVIDPESDNPTELVGRAYLNPADNYDKEVGRRLALDRAVTVPFDDRGTVMGNKTQREIWAGYFTR